MPRPSRGSVRRLTSPRAARRSTRFVIVPLDTRVCCSSDFGLSSYGSPARRSADSTSNSHGSTSLASNAARRARSRCRASRSTRDRTSSGPKSRSARSRPHAATIRSTSSCCGILHLGRSRRARPASGPWEDGRAPDGLHPVRVFRLGVTAARRPLVPLGPGSNPGGGAWGCSEFSAISVGKFERDIRPRWKTALSSAPRVARPVPTTAGERTATRALVCVRFEERRIPPAGRGEGEFRVYEVWRRGLVSPVVGTLVVARLR